MVTRRASADDWLQEEAQARCDRARAEGLPPGSQPTWTPAMREQCAVLAGQQLVRFEEVEL